MGGILFHVPDSGPTYEDFTTYTEVDAGGHITVATNKLTGVVPETAESYVYKDFTADYFDSDYEIQWKMNVAASSEDAALGVFILANDLDDCRAAAYRRAGASGNLRQGQKEDRRRLGPRGRQNARR